MGGTYLPSLYHSFPCTTHLQPCPLQLVFQVYAHLQRHQPNTSAFPPYNSSRLSLFHFSCSSTASSHRSETANFSAKPLLHPPLLQDRPLGPADLTPSAPDNELSMFIPQLHVCSAQKCCISNTGLLKKCHDLPLAGLYLAFFFFLRDWKERHTAEPWMSLQAEANMRPDTAGSA